MELLLAAAAVLLAMGMLAKCFSLSQSLSFPELLRENFGGLPARIILAGTAVYFAAEICCVTVKQTRMTGLFLLEKTPPQVIPAVTLLTVCFLITSGIRQVARTAELLFPAVAGKMGIDQQSEDQPGLSRGQDVLLEKQRRRGKGDQKDQIQSAARLRKPLQFVVHGRASSLCKNSGRKDG